MNDTVEPTEWIFTFGSGHVHPTTGEPLGQRFVRIAGTRRVARARMVERFGIKWSHQYAANQPDAAGVERFGLEELPPAQWPPPPIGARHVQWDGGGRELGLRCEHCGDRYALPLPCSVSVVAAVLRAYVDDHSGCRPRVESEPAP